MEPILTQNSQLNWSAYILHNNIWMKTHEWRIYKFPSLERQRFRWVGTLWWGRESQTSRDRKPWIILKQFGVIAIGMVWMSWWKNLRLRTDKGEVESDRWSWLKIWGKEICIFTYLPISYSDLQSQCSERPGRLWWEPRWSPYGWRCGRNGDSPAPCSAGPSTRRHHTPT